jgi:hypothetical protein
MEHKTKFYRILLDCPFTDPLSDCQLHHFRKMPITLLIESTRLMKIADMADLVEHHNECIKKRGQSKLAS